MLFLLRRLYTEKPKSTLKFDILWVFERLMSRWCVYWICWSLYLLITNISYPVPDSTYKFSNSVNGRPEEKTHEADISVLKNFPKTTVLSSWFLSWSAEKNSSSLNSDILYLTSQHRSQGGESYELFVDNLIRSKAEKTFKKYFDFFANFLFVSFFRKIFEK